MFWPAPDDFGGERVLIFTVDWAQPFRRATIEAIAGGTQSSLARAALFATGHQAASLTLVDELAVFA